MLGTAASRRRRAARRRPGRCLWWGRAAVRVHALRFGEGGQGVADARLELGDLLVQELDLLQFQLVSSPWWASNMPVSASTSHRAWLSSGCGAGLRARAGRVPGDHRRTMSLADSLVSCWPRRQLDQRAFEQLLQPLVAAGPLADVVGAAAGRSRSVRIGAGRHEARPQHPPLRQPGQPHRVVLIGLRAALELPGLGRGHQLRSPARALPAGSRRSASSRWSPPA